MVDVQTTWQARATMFSIHNFDIRARLLVSIALAASTAAVQHVLEMVLLLVALVVLYASAQVPLRTVHRTLRPFLWLALVAVLLGNGEGGYTLLRLNAWQYTTGDALAGGWVGLRVLFTVASVTWLTLTCSPSDLTLALQQLLAPLRKLGVPIDTFALAVLVALRFVPMLTLEIGRVRKAQVARGVDCVGGVKGVWRRSISLVIPVFAAGIRRADVLADALVLRGYHMGVTTVPASTAVPLQLRDYVLLVGVWFFTLLLLVLK